MSGFSIGRLARLFMPCAAPPPAADPSAPGGVLGVAADLADEEAGRLRAAGWRVSDAADLPLPGALARLLRFEDPQ